MGKIEGPKEIWISDKLLKDLIDFTIPLEYRALSMQHRTKYFNASLLDDPEWLSANNLMRVPEPECCCGGRGYCQEVDVDSRSISTWDCPVCKHLRLGAKD